MCGCEHERPCDSAASVAVLTAYPMLARFLLGCVEPPPLQANPLEIAAPQESPAAMYHRLAALI